MTVLVGGEIFISLTCIIAGRSMKALPLLKRVFTFHDVFVRHA